MENQKNQKNPEPKERILAYKAAQLVDERDYEKVFGGPIREGYTIRETGYVYGGDVGAYWF